MEEFIDEIHNNIGTVNLDTEKKISRYKELYQYIISSPKAEIKIIEKCNDEGEVKFEVPIRALGLSYENYDKYRPELVSRYAANVIGELLVRENIDKFVRILTELKDDYMPIVNKWKHKDFGLFTVRDKFHFVFHISLIQNILTEEIKRIV